MPTAELIIDLGSGSSAGGGISGPRSQSLIIERTANDELIISPTEYLELRTEHLSHVQVRE